MLGPDHHDVAVSLNNLALVERARVRYVGFFSQLFGCTVSSLKLTPTVEYPPLYANKISLATAYRQPYGIRKQTIVVWRSGSVCVNIVNKASRHGVNGERFALQL